MRFHVATLPHTYTHKDDHPACAYTQKVRLFCEMMNRLGHDVIHYGGEKSEVICSEHVVILTEEERLSWWGKHDPLKEQYKLEWSSAAIYWQKANARTIDEIKKRIAPVDFICLIAGSCHKPIMNAFPNNISVEFGVGYKGIVAKFCAFESYAWMHHVYGLLGMNGGRHFDAVIPNYYAAEDFPAGPGGEYFAFVGRMNVDKGPNIAADVTRECGARLLMAGQGIVDYDRTNFIHKGNGVSIVGAHVEHLGTVLSKEKAKLMGGAQALICPTQYIGPFEGVHVEAMLCGTPVITTDFGVFAETVEDGVTGFRCRTFGEMVWAAKEAKKLDREVIRKKAHDRFTLDVVGMKFEQWFKQLMLLWEEGWPSMKYDPEGRNRK